MIANCDALVTRYSSVVHVAIALGKEVHADIDDLAADHPEGGRGGRGWGGGLGPEGGEPKRELDARRRRAVLVEPEGALETASPPPGPAAPEKPLGSAHLRARRDG